MDRMVAVAVTAHARPKDRLRALQAGYQSHLSKPFERRELVAVIASLLASEESAAASSTGLTAPASPGPPSRTAE